ncbi:hypothetical protein [Agromyces flavus]|uniref:hypothetical protein n=1 Tax=Agromyces flavus TaxID=589382 RepID=UPI001E36DEFB|nr:hypothetical protein [Agromyces flavus]
MPADEAFPAPFAGAGAGAAEAAARRPVRATSAAVGRSEAWGAGVLAPGRAPSGAGSGSRRRRRGTDGGVAASNPGRADGETGEETWPEAVGR